METAAYLDIARIQEYILSPPPLKMKRGASLILRDFDAQVHRLAAQYCPAGRVVFSNGGNSLAVFSSGSDAKKFCTEAERVLREMTDVARLRYATCTTNP